MPSAFPYRFLPITMGVESFNAYFNGHSRDLNAHCHEISQEVKAMLKII
jgi:hypothetical protein